MALTITALPTAPNKINDSPAVFTVKADAWVDAMSLFTTEANALAAEAENNAATAEAKALEASGYADVAAASAATAVAAPGTNATSNTSLAIGTGSRSCTIQTGKFLVAGMKIIVARTGYTTTHWMYGTVTSYNSGTGALVFTSETYVGTGTYTTWTISLTGPGSGIQSITAGTGITVSGSGDKTISHSDTSSQGSVNNSGATVIQDVTLDGYGHITALGNVTLTYSTVGAAASSHTHSTYLPLAGGTMSGPVTLGTNYLRYDDVWSYPNFRMSSDGCFMEVTATDKLILSQNVGLTLSMYNLTSTPSKGLFVTQGGTTYGRFGVSNLGEAEVYGASLAILRGAGTKVFAGAGAFSPYYGSTVNLGANDVDLAWNNIYYTGTSNDISDERLKDISSMGDVSWLYDVNPISFVWKDGDDKRIRFGFGAQSLYEILPERLKDNSGIVAKDFDEKKNDYNWAVSKTELVAPMLRLIQEQKKMIDSLTERITKLESQ